VSGKWVLDRSFKIPRTPPCAQANYVVSELEVGAYRMDSLDLESSGGHARMITDGISVSEESDRRDISQQRGGDLSKCGQPRTDGPIPNCSLPLRMLGVPIDASRWSE
jgi:hypothetical protein